MVPEAHLRRHGFAPLEPRLRPLTVAGRTAPARIACVEHDSLDPPDDAEALLFDCDGTLVDTLSLYRICWRQVFGRHGFDMTDEWFDARAGVNLLDFIPAAFPDEDEATIERIRDEGMAMFMESIHLIEPFEHVVDVARRYHGRLPMAVVSSGPDDAVHKSLLAAGIADLFDFVLTLDTVEASKPAPDPYLVAIARMGVSAERCVAYEDSEIGIESASAAGVGTIYDVRLRD